MVIFTTVRINLLINCFQSLWGVANILSPDIIGFVFLKFCFSISFFEIVLIFFFFFFFFEGLYFQGIVDWNWCVLQGGKEYLMRAHFGLPSVVSDDVEGKPPIQVRFEIPYFTTSGIQVY